MLLLVFVPVWVLLVREEGMGSRVYFLLASRATRRMDLVCVRFSAMPVSFVEVVVVVVVVEVGTTTSLSRSCLSKYCSMC